MGIDLEEDMISKARKLSKSYKNCFFEVGDILEFPMENTDFITSYYTIQFTKPSVRHLIFEKILTPLIGVEPLLCSRK